MKTIFEGTINGEKFNSVQAYNARMIELMNAGKEVNASSHTKSVNESAGCDCRCTCDKSEETCTTPSLEQAVKNLVDAIDDTETCYPYFDAEEPHYLDILVSTDSETNKNLRKEMHDQLQRSWNTITEELYDADVDIDDKKEYLEEVRNIISKIETDNANNIKTISCIDNNRKEAQATFNKAHNEYKRTIDKCEKEKSMLVDATTIIADMLEFYRAVEAEGLQAIKENTIKENNTPTCTECSEATNKHKSNNTINDIITSLKETNPQIEMDLADAFSKLFTSFFNKR